jgi:hypothetical protein
LVLVTHRAPPMIVIQPMELHIHVLAPTKITFEVILHLSKNSWKVTFF